MNGYLHETVIINAREIKLSSVADQTVLPQTEFERETISFIHSWITGISEFQIPTSGSTGRPKIITLTRDQMEQSARATIEALSLSPGSTSLVCLHTKFIAGKMQLVRAFVNNMKIIANEPSSNPLLRSIDDHQIDFAAFVPLQLHTMLSDGWTDKLNTIKTIIVGGAPVTGALRKLLLDKLKNRVFITYGMTETISHIALQPVQDTTQTYQTLPGVRISTDERGCLVICVPYISAPVITNDVVELLSPDTFRWSGRIDNVINSGGVKIQPEKVESVIDEIFLQMNVDQRYFIAARPDDLLGEMLLLIIEGDPLSPSTTSILWQHMDKNLSSFEKPKEIITTRQFANTETGKTDRIKTLEMLEKQGFQER